MTTVRTLDVHSLDKKAMVRLSTTPDAIIIQSIEDGFKRLQVSTPEQCHSLLKKHLSAEIKDNLKTIKASTGATLFDVCQAGFKDLGLNVGAYAPDAESYTVFSPLFSPIIEDYHGGFKSTDKHPATDFGDGEKLIDFDLEGKFVIQPVCAAAATFRIELKIITILKNLKGDLAGTYYPLADITKEVQEHLIDNHFLFKEGSCVLQAANACRYWPIGRGIYHNPSKSFLVWVNEEDHLRVISMQKGGDLKSVYSRMVSGVKAIETKLQFARDERLGFLAFCSTNLGTAIRASVHISLPKLAADHDRLVEAASKHKLQVRGIGGEYTKSEGSVYDISNNRRLGLTEYQAVCEMQDRILQLIKLEKSL